MLPALLLAAATATVGATNATGVVDFARSIVDELASTPKGKLPCTPLQYLCANPDLVPLRHDGMFLEFGVFRGTTINLLASSFPTRTMHGFDSFQGLPENWTVQHTQGHFSLSGAKPRVLANVRLHAGWFNETLPRFVSSENMSRIALLHVDCDLYSSTSIVFHNLSPFIVPGTVVVFDELVGYPEYMKHEMKAFFEFVSSHGNLSYQVIGGRNFDHSGKPLALRPNTTAPASSQAVAVRIVAAGSASSSTGEEEKKVRSCHSPSREGGSETVFSPEEEAEVMVLDSDHFGSWVRCKILVAGAGQYDIEVLPTEGLMKYAGMVGRGVSSKHLRKASKGTGTSQGKQGCEGELASALNEVKYQRAQAESSEKRRADGGRKLAELQAHHNACLRKLEELESLPATAERVREVAHVGTSFPLLILVILVAAALGRASAGRGVLPGSRASDTATAMMSIALLSVTVRELLSFTTL
eukprot:Sspe_Gene.85729::Locus_56476_Transcript_1_1_Confidence_1.000_Length_1544::g.85729::m.85729